MVQFLTNSASRAIEPPIMKHYTAAACIAERVAWRDVGYAVLDVETTGLNTKRDAILSIGLVEIEQGRIMLERTWYALVQPPPHVTVPAESIRIHRLFRGDVAAAPTLDQILPELLERLMGRVLVVHFAQIDIDFINRALHQLWRAKLRGPALDTMRIAQALYHQERWLTGHDGMHSVTSLRELAQRYNLPIHSEHNALSDAITTAQLFLAQATRLERRGEGLLLHLLNKGRCLR